ncbi:uncharacterized protein LOC113088993 isoform X1 [Carassius auratus]|uniref:Uncharacterized protein LOC113088993 isoform X1 n=1 Tax=Carassius auratus TaxID=7957 RepID=A0A6P6NSW1_CARAU|nr:uncharacterized protein LOC113088993 isoform X1 [Carassius auratus]
MAGGGLKKSCPTCQEKIFNGCKVCPMCKTAQPQHLRLKKKIEKFKMEKESWVAKKKKNQITSHLMDDAVILIEKLNAVGWRPMLFLEYPNKEVKMLLPEGLELSSGENICLNNMNAIYSMIVQGKTVPADPSSNQASTSNLQLGPEEETIVVLNLESIQDPPPQQEEALLLTSPATNTNEGAQTETEEALLSTIPATNTNEGAQTETEEALLLTSPATNTNEGAQTETEEALLSTSPATNTNEGAQTETEEALLSTSPATNTNEGLKKDKTPKRRQRTKVSKKEKDCPHNSQEVHAYRCVIKTRKRKGKMEKLIDWLPCKLCGKTWPPTWETA